MIEFQIDVDKLLKALDKTPEAVDTTIYDDRIRRKAETARRWQEKNPEKAKEAAKRSYNLHKAYYREKYKLYRATHKAHLQKLARESYSRRRIAINAALRERYANDPEFRERRRSFNRVSAERNRDKRLAYAAEYRAREEVKERARKWRVENAERLRAYAHEKHRDRYLNDSEFRERAKERAKAYYQRNREKVIARTAARRARIRARKTENETPAS